MPLKPELLALVPDPTGVPEAAPAKRVLAYTVPEASAATGLPRTSLYRANKEGRLPFRKFGRRTLIFAADLETFLETLPKVAA